MIEPWNDASILPPATNTTPQNVSNIGIQKFKNVCKNIIIILSQQSPLYKESILLSRFLYKFDKKFRNDIGYRNLKKVNTALSKYLAINLLQDIKHFHSVLPSPDDDIYLPTRQMLEYILVRLMTFSKILFRNCVCSKRAAIFYFDRVKRAESHWMSLMPYALLSRVWSVSMVLLEHSISWYSTLYPYLDKLQLKGINFLPDEYSLPSDIETWMDIKNLDMHGKFKWSLKKKHLGIDTNFETDESDNMIDSILEYVNEINESDSEDLIQKNNLNIRSTNTEFEEHFHENVQNVDKGESISREYFKSFFNDPARKQKKEMHFAENITSKASLQQFLHNEELYRNKDDNKSLTQHLSFMQWQALKNALVKLHDSLANNRKIERKFKKIWKEKCLDYL